MSVASQSPCSPLTLDTLIHSCGFGNHLEVGTPEVPPLISSRPNYPVTGPSVPGCAAGTSDSNPSQTRLFTLPLPPAVCIRVLITGTFLLYLPVRGRCLVPQKRGKQAGRRAGLSAQTGLSDSIHIAWLRLRTGQFLTSDPQASRGWGSKCRPD